MTIDNEIIEIELDIDHELILKQLTLYVKDHLSPTSQSIYDDALANDLDMDKVFEAVGKAVFNDILLDCITQQIDREKSNVGDTE